ncbi:flagellar hook-basal body complex protein FliE [Sulfitobacter sp. CW3]|jgi:flagellar hook-basal body complex protein FliE|uniref:flagellar hook-basal body complex protein FliE n=1 Tax=unclassified Sulfitobacter TaxID=196795 RepID=UPI0019E3F89A|nr:flagellar hook-basal body complex protein FliE [Sulfitobacter sp. CW3]MBW4961631.1 flagellar hook-basal body complex protein FliE [Sulfitobacter sp. CW3]NOR32209.1 flagellar biosynthesis protein [Sulfitobacter sp.]|tara:strand:- start:48323 stop:48649 length:327 start_codon:yes stop_codon:yes gene_type:complete
MSDPASLISSAAVRGAYRTSQSLTGQKGEGAAEEVSATSFSNMVRSASEAALETVRAGEATAQAGLRGEADTQNVVEAMLAMESTVKVAVSVRDRFVEAYQEILRMPI